MGNKLAQESVSIPGPKKILFFLLGVVLALVVGRAFIIVSLTMAGNLLLASGLMLETALAFAVAMLLFLVFWKLFKPSVWILLGLLAGFMASVVWGYMEPVTSSLLGGF